MTDTDRRLHAPEVAQPEPDESPALGLCRIGALVAALIAATAGVAFGVFALLAELR